MSEESDAFENTTLLHGTAQTAPLHPKHDPSHHDFVDESMWCITRKDLHHFEEEVRKALKNGTIKEDPDFPDKDFHNPKVGPNMYNVNRDLIKPMTAMAGGMSWALMREPDGRRCDVFASHSWKEGVFEFTRKVRQVWPADATNMYVCFLANPQNGDINLLLKGRSLKEVPFAKALRTASYVVLVPNKTCSIYTRLWCVFELYLALKAIRDDPESKMRIKLPWVASHGCVAVGTLPAVMLIPLPTAFFAYYYLGSRIGILLGPLMWQLVTFSFTATMTAVMRWATDVAWHHQWLSRKSSMGIMICWEYLEFFLGGLAAGLGMWHFHGRSGDVSNRTQVKEVAAHFGEQSFGIKKWEPGEVVPLTLLILSLFSMYTYKIFMVLVRDVVEREGHELQTEHSSVKDAVCSDLGDQENILSYIRGEEDDIDQLIDDLKLVGRYDRMVDYMLKKGMHPSTIRDSVNPFKICLGCVAFEFWWITDLRSHNLSLIAATVPLCSISLVMFIVFRRSAFRHCALKFDDRYIFAVNTFAYWGVGFAMTSNHRLFFNREAVADLDMSLHTAWLQLLFLVGMLVTDAFFYSGAFGAVKKCIHQSYVGLVSRIGQVRFAQEGELLDDSRDSYAPVDRRSMPI